ncbi:MAG TPA: hypothetical protein VFV33_12940, partial [Gemmatimonadaceae bacterium]|nr:hypothetical protein [Gemmatimonadaceae bacterium]
MIPRPAQAGRTPSLERASDWLRAVASTPEACFDDLGPPTYDEFQFLRRSFLDRLAAEARANGDEAVS